MRKDKLLRIINNNNGDRNRNINSYKIMPKDKLLRIINNNKGDKNSLSK